MLKHVDKIIAGDLIIDFKLLKYLKSIGAGSIVTKVIKSKNTVDLYFNLQLPPYTVCIFTCDKDRYFDVRNKVFKLTDIFRFCNYTNILNTFKK